MKLIRLTLLAAATTPALSWSTDVHNQIGHLAAALLSPRSKTLLTSLLSNSSLGAAASWADAYAHTPEGHFSYQWHWIDTHDNPPKSCFLNYEKDCAKGGCVVSAIGNQTRILSGCVAEVKKEGGLVAEDKAGCEKALKWILHFVGDVHQPLHASGKAQGGNGVNVTFGGKETELHAVWDALIPHELASLPTFTRFPTTYLATYFSTLLSRIQRDAFATPVYLWRTCINSSTPEECATEWARESNSWTCDYVYKYLGEKGVDLKKSGYVEGARIVVEGRLARAGVRLAGLLEDIVAGAEGREEMMEL